VTLLGRQIFLLDDVLVDHLRFSEQSNFLGVSIIRQLTQFFDHFLVIVEETEEFAVKVGSRRTQRALSSSE